MRILLVEDDKDLCALMQANLAGEGYTVDSCHDGMEGLRYMRERIHDAVLLDRMLPELDGLSVLKTARREGISVPVILLTALGELPQVIEGLDSGADDYITKPFAVDELLARVRAIQRRPAGFEGEAAIEAGGVTLYPSDKLMECRGKRCTLSKRECTLLELLLRNAGKTLPRSAIFSYVWGMDAPVEDANLDNYIHFVRERLREVGAPLVIQTVRGVGYRLEAADV